MRVPFTKFLRTAALGLLLGTAGMGQARADEALRHIQQSLRDQGFYYGPIDGSPGDETTQALRRYQIRNGLAVTGQLNDETRRSIDKTGAAIGSSGGGSRGAAGSGNTDASTPPPLGTSRPGTTRRTSPTTADDAPSAAPAPAYRPPPTARAPVDPDDQDDAAPAPQRGPGNIRPDLRVRPDGPSTGDDNSGGGYGNAVPRGGIPPSATLSAVFASTPYEFAPPPVQADVLRRAQAFLGRNGFYDGRADGAPGPATTDALVNYQEVNRLRRTGRLDVSTLGSMRLLPGRQTVAPRRYDDPRQPGPNIIFQGRIVN